MDSKEIFDWFDSESCVQIDVDENYISLYPKKGYPDGYHIPKWRCNTPGKILGWMDHLAGKGWLDDRAIANFARIAFKSIGIEIEYSF